MDIQGTRMYYATIEESIKDILVTPLGSRVMLPEYGSKIFELIDRKMDDGFMADLTIFVVEAIEKWETRVRITQVLAKKISNGKLSITLVFENYPTVEVSV